MGRRKPNEIPLDLGSEDAGTERASAKPEHVEIPAVPGSIHELVEDEPTQTGGSVLDDADNETFIPVHGFVRLTNIEMMIVNHPAFQRLGTIYQLGHTHLVYRGATHRRFEHVLGTLHVAQMMVDAVKDNHRRARKREAEQLASSLRPARLANALSDVEIVFVRLAALLHDIGHLPEGHTLEDELGFLDKHDKPSRINTVLDVMDWPGGETLSLRSVIDLNYRSWLKGDEITPSQLLIQIVAKDPPKEFRTVAESILRVDVCRDIVGNTICADLLDYLHRDWYHIGKPKNFDQRLFQYMEIRENHKGKDEFVISLGVRPKLRTDAITAILGLLESRYELAEAVLFHRTKCAAAAMLERALFEIESSLSADKRDHWKQQLERKLLFNADDSVIDLLTEEAESIGAVAAIRPLSALRQRRLYKGISTTFHDQLASEDLRRLQRLYAGSIDAARARNEAMRTLEKDFNLPSGSLAIYSPDKGMNQKIAGVKIHVNGHVEVFREWDAENKKVLSGGHLEAQLDRFKNLWRIHVVVAGDTWARLSPALRAALQGAIELCILGHPSYSGQPFESASEALARQLSVIEDSPYAGMQVGAGEVGARDGDIQIAYPTGAPSIRSFFPSEPRQ